MTFIYTNESFVIDEVSVKNASDKQVATLLEEDKYGTLYHMTFQDTARDSPTAKFLKEVVQSFVRSLLASPEIEIAREKTKAVLDEDQIENLLSLCPFALGSEFVDEEWLKLQYDQLQHVFEKEATSFEGTMQLYFESLSQNLQTAQRIYFHLVENPLDEDNPFAFMATYATKDQAGRVRHMPLAHTLIEYKDHQEELLALLSSLNKVADEVEYMQYLMDTGELFHPIKLNVKEAYTLLKAIPLIEKSGIKCRVPNWWKKHYASVHLNVSAGEKKPSFFGLETLIALTPSLTINGHMLSQDDINYLLKQEEGLIFMKGQWVEVNHQKLQELLQKMEHYDGTITLKEALTKDFVKDIDDDPDNGIEITNGKWLRNMMQEMRQPRHIQKLSLPEDFDATLRHYQQEGYNWLNIMYTFGFGACLADDMGLGKTIQVIAFLEKLREEDADAKCLLVVPASLLGNWESEMRKFAPDLHYFILHSSKIKDYQAYQEDNPYLTITTYGMASKIEGLSQRDWNVLILDEAQAIKNPITKQTKTMKKIPARFRIAMTGTPIENDYSNLWSLFDFLNKGLLGSFDQFKRFSKTIEDYPENTTKLRNLVSPFILRRLKTDKSIISDLPAKIEIVDHVNLSKRQIVLYKKQVEQLKEDIETAQGMERRGIVLSYITKFKQICNHPDQFNHDISFKAIDSGKYQMLKELCTTIYEKRERVLVFTQYREMCEPLSQYLASIFHKEGYIINGSTPIKKRTEIVNKFQSEHYIPYIVLTVKAAGTGLNLTAANHVIHFDRWWNPAVENQASDRAYRIGQKKKVFVHKLVSTGTIEEKIDELITSKQSLANNILSTNDQINIAEMSNDELINLFQLEV
ncbi:DEAD/DEAH box helicase [Sharpea azabuensis]|uniref:DEAD/DEAH box helicase n=1 Tax=Sharpea azabuensis TaxID=322505 RepID=UPI0023F09333|nr:DEAD/DEAH box helicase [Sharpea azabuensis]